MALNTKNNTPNTKGFNWVGALLLFVIMSIAYSTYVVYFGTTGWIPKIMLVPQALFAAWVAITKFANK